MKPAYFISVCALAVMLCACGNIQTVKSFSTPYQEPLTGARARIRVVSDGMVRAVPNSDCVDWRIAGAGVMVSAMKGFANLNDRKLDMPASAAQALVVGSHFAVSELQIPAGKPVTLDYLSQGAAGYQCFVRRSFVPMDGRNYEAVFWQDKAKCYFRVNEIEHGSAPIPIELAPAKWCRVSDNL